MEKQTLRYEREDLQEAVRVMREGGIILYPTDTVWGIGCDATNAAAVERIYRLKQRSDSKAMLCLLDAPGKLQGYVTVPSAAWDLLECTGESSRPLTIIYPGARSVAENLIAEDGSLGIRITEEPFSKALCAMLHHPVVSTSANISGEPAARSFREITEAIRDGVDYICRFRQKDPCNAKPSSIIKLGMNNEVQVIRP
ncbi:MAG: threonylcarbamoyl-AMP synthase [Paludibacteraceae bacterium]|nr:threonylcarbamoyl-AMP synthase [Paludibacteraceae bacterium]